MNLLIFIDTYPSVGKITDKFYQYMVNFVNEKEITMTTEKTAEELGITEFEKFCNDLAEYMCNWIPSAQNKVIPHAQEIFADKTLRKMIETYAELKTSSDRIAKYEFVKACIGEDANCVDEVCEELCTSRMKAYAEVLNDLIFARYCRNS